MILESDSIAKGLGMSQNLVSEIVILVRSLGEGSREGGGLPTIKFGRLKSIGHRECKGGGEANSGAAGCSPEDEDFPGGRTCDTG